MNCQDLHISPLSGDYKKQNFCCIYKIVAKSNGRHYIGSAKHFGIRRRNHTHKLLKNTHPNVILQNHVNKYGIEDLYFEIIELLEWGDLVKDREQYYIDSTSPYFNVLRNARTRLNYKVSDETRAKLRSSHLGKKQTEETKYKRSLSAIETMASLSEEKKEKRKRGGYSKRKKVICIETGIIYNSITEAELKTGADNVWNVCVGNRRKANGLTFKYYQDEL